ncbi:hypothetical protein D3C72_2440170 [compost metagenome]
MVVGVCCTRASKRALSCSCRSLGSLLGFKVPSSICLSTFSATLVSQPRGTKRVSCVAAQGVP